MIALPPLTYYFWICISRFDGAFIFPTSRQAWSSLLAMLPAPTGASLILYFGWFALQAMLQVAAPGKVLQGLPLADGSRLSYRMNGWFSFCSTFVVAGALVATGWISPTVLYDQFGPLLTTANLFAFALAVFMYLLGKRSRTPERRSGNLLYDYFLGTALNPRIGSFDLKLFCESRPGLILWVLIDLSMAAEQYRRQGAVTTPMLLVIAFQFLYVADYFFYEEAILTTWDIRYENFGWMLCWGDLVWVPFTYTLQASYLVYHTHELPMWATAAIVGLNMMGYWIFRASNLQKHRFRKDPDRLVWGKKPQYLETSRGSLLLTSGWWGISRHMNYCGDLLMALAWCLPALFEHPLPYFYVVYVTILLLHRERRDHATCLAKYGADWTSYCSNTRWRIIPGIY